MNTFFSMTYNMDFYNGSDSIWDIDDNRYNYY